MTWIEPDWAAPRNVRAFVTTREGGVSSGEFASLNLGTGSGDDPAHVARNRLIVRERLPAMPRWMKQVHGTGVGDLDARGDDDVPVADAAVVSSPGRVGAVLTADCMPLSSMCRTLAGKARRLSSSTPASTRPCSSMRIQRIAPIIQSGVPSPVSGTASPTSSPMRARTASPLGPRSQTRRYPPRL